MNSTEENLGPTRLITGPTKAWLADSLFKGIEAPFQIEPPKGSFKGKHILMQDIKVVLSGADLEDGSRNKFLIRGKIIVSGTEKQFDFEGYYCTAEHKGWIKEVLPEMATV